MTLIADEDDEMTELFDADISRIDLVHKAASGIPRFLIAKSAADTGMFRPDYVRSLIAKSRADDSPARPRRVSQEELARIVGSAARSAVKQRRGPKRKVAKAATEAAKSAERIRQRAAEVQAAVDRISAERAAAARTPVLKARLSGAATAAERVQAIDDMNRLAIAKLAQIRAAGRSR